MQNLKNQGKNRARIVSRATIQLFLLIFCPCFVV
jgi:hypothetical protein